MARKPHLAAMLNDELDAYMRALRVETAAVLVEKELRKAMDAKHDLERDRDQMRLPWDEPDAAAELDETPPKT